MDSLSSIIEELLEKKNSLGESKLRVEIYKILKECIKPINTITYKDNILKKNNDTEYNSKLTTCHDILANITKYAQEADNYELKSINEITKLLDYMYNIVGKLDELYTVYKSIHTIILRRVPHNIDYKHEETTLANIVSIAEPTRRLIMESSACIVKNAKKYKNIPNKKDINIKGINSDNAVKLANLMLDRYNIDLIKIDDFNDEDVIYVLNIIYTMLNIDCDINKIAEDINNFKKDKKFIVVKDFILYVIENNKDTNKFKHTIIKKIENIFIENDIKIDKNMVITENISKSFNNIDIIINNSKFSTKTTLLKYINDTDENGSIQDYITHIVDTYYMLSIKIVNPEGPYFIYILKIFNNYATNDKPFYIEEDTDNKDKFYKSIVCAAINKIVMKDIDNINFDSSLTITPSSTDPYKIYELCEKNKKESDEIILTKAETLLKENENYRHYHTRIMSNIEKLIKTNSTEHDMYDYIIDEKCKKSLLDMTMHVWSLHKIYHSCFYKPQIIWYARDSTPLSAVNFYTDDIEHKVEGKPLKNTVLHTVFTGFQIGSVEYNCNVVFFNNKKKS